MWWATRLLPNWAGNTRTFCPFLAQALFPLCLHYSVKLPLVSCPGSFFLFSSQTSAEGEILYAFGLYKRVLYFLDGLKKSYIFCILFTVCLIVWLRVTSFTDFHIQILLHWKVCFNLKFFMDVFVSYNILCSGLQLSDSIVLYIILCSHLLINNCCISQCCTMYLCSYLFYYQSWFDTGVSVIWYSTKEAIKKYSRK